ncbi:MAG: flagellar hook-length control protein FliK [Pseudomonadota bacterium]
MKESAVEGSIADVTPFGAFFRQEAESPPADIPSGDVLLMEAEGEASVPTENASDQNTRPVEGVEPEAVDDFFLSPELAQSSATEGRGKANIESQPGLGTIAQATAKGALEPAAPIVLEGAQPPSPNAINALSSHAPHVVRRSQTLPIPMGEVAKAGATPASAQRQNDLPADVPIQTRPESRNEPFVRGQAQGVFFNTARRVDGVPRADAGPPLTMQNQDMQHDMQIGEAGSKAAPALTDDLRPAQSETASRPQKPASGVMIDGMQATSAIPGEERLPASQGEPRLRAPWSGADIQSGPPTQAGRASLGNVSQVAGADVQDLPLDGRAPRPTTLDDSSVRARAERAEPVLPQATAAGPSASSTDGRPADPAHAARHSERSSIEIQTKPTTPTDGSTPPKSGEPMLQHRPNPGMTLNPVQNNVVTNVLSKDMREIERSVSDRPSIRHAGPRYDVKASVSDSPVPLSALNASLGSKNPIGTGGAAFAANTSPLDPEAELSIPAISTSPLAGSTGPASPVPTSPTAPAIAHQIAHAAQGIGAGHSTEIKLNPAELGSVRIVMTTQETGLIVSLMVERPETADLMRRHIDSLMQEFEALGYDDVSFDFDGRGTESSDPDAHVASGDDDRPALESDQTAEAVTNAPRRVATPSSTGLDLKL